MKTLIGNIKKAVIEMLILKLLSESDMYGYQITQEIKKRSNGTFTILEGSMYPILYRLTDNNCISFYEKKIGIRQSRVYYHIEPLGLERFVAMKNQFHTTIHTIEFLMNSQEGDTYE